MQTQVSISKGNAFSLNISLRSIILTVAVIAAIATFVAVCLSSDIFSYICATVALAAVYALDRNCVTVKEK